MTLQLLLLCGWGLLTLGMFHFIWSGVCLYRNYKQALKIGVPIRVIPIDHVNILWLLMDKQVVRLVSRLPGILGRNNFTRFNYRGWHEDGGIDAHNELGEAFVLVTPSRNWFYLANPDALMDMYRRGRDFPRWVEITKMLNIFGGPNIATASGEHWKVHRKIVASCLGERVNSIVWSESARLGEQMAQYWGRQQILTTIGEDTRTLSLDVLGKACFGQSFDFEGHNERAPSSISASFRFSLLTVMENSLLILAMTPKFFQNRWLPLPASWKRLGQACETFQRHMTEQYDAELLKLAQGDTVKDPTLMASLVRSSRGVGHGRSLSEAEIYGTMFVVSFAGHDTTAHLITYAMFFLAANPVSQDWLFHELKRVLSDRPREQWDYHHDFPRLKRCMAILFETLRLKTPAAEAKWTSNKTQSIFLNGKAVEIPAKTLVIPSYWYAQKHTKYWGSDALVWKPERWIVSGCGDRHHIENEACLRCDGKDEVLLPPPSRGNFLGWSEGTRDCPAKKFSQVEWVGVMAALFRNWRIEPLRKNGETLEEAGARVLDFIEKDTDYGGLLLQLMHPERIPLVFTKRET